MGWWKKERGWRKNGLPMQEKNSILFQATTGCNIFNESWSGIPTCHVCRRGVSHSYANVSHLRQGSIFQVPAILTHITSALHSRSVFGSLKDGWGYRIDHPVGHLASSNTFTCIYCIYIYKQHIIYIILYIYNI